MGNSIGDDLARVLLKFTDADRLTHVRQWSNWCSPDRTASEARPSLGY